MRIHQKYFTSIAITTLLLIGLIACKRDYIVGADSHDVDMYKNISTYDALKKFPDFDTLVQLIDAGDLKEVINQQNTTFFAVTNASVFSYLDRRTVFLQNTVDQNKKFLLDSLLYYIQNNKDNTRDSLLMYLVPDVQITPQNLNKTGKIYPSALTGSNVIVSFEDTREPNDGYNGSTTVIPQLLYLTQLWKPYQPGPDSTAADVPPATGIRTRIKTSFINTQNGVINAMAAGTLFYYGQRVN